MSLIWEGFNEFNSKELLTSRPFIKIRILPFPIIEILSSLTVTNGKNDNTEYTSGCFSKDEPETVILYSPFLYTTHLFPVTTTSFNIFSFGSSIIVPRFTESLCCFSKEIL